MKWYVLQVKNGDELKVRDALFAAGIPAKVPREVRHIRSGGSWSEKEYVLMPGYVFFGAEHFSAEHYYAAKRIPSVQRILGTPTPQPISYAEAEYLAVLTPDEEPLQASVIRVEDGTAKAVSGVLTRIPARLLKLEARQRRAKVLLTILGEERTVEFAVKIEEADGDGTPKDENDAAEHG